MTMRKKPLFLILIVFAAVALAGCTFGATKPASKGKCYLNDGANLMPSEDEAQVQEAMEKLSEYGNVAVVTTNSVAGTTAAYASDKYGSLFGTESGLLFVIDMDNREIWIETDGYIGRYLTRGKCRTIADNVYVYASAANYAKCAILTLEQALDVMEGRQIPETMAHMSNAVLAVLAGLLINFVVLRMLNRKPEVSTTELTTANRGRATFRSVDESLSSVERRKRPAIVILQILWAILRAAGESGGSSHSGGGGRSGGGGGHHGSHGGGHRF